MARFDVLQRLPRLLQLLWREFHDARRTVCIGICCTFSNAGHDQPRQRAGRSGDHIIPIRDRHSGRPCWDLHCLICLVCWALCVELVLDICQTSA